jgi:hypothetical protein
MGGIPVRLMQKAGWQSDSVHALMGPLEAGIPVVRDHRLDVSGVDETSNVEVSARRFSVSIESNKG